ncbi:MAG: TlpA family protein disulfide reductase [Nitrospira sp. SB0677_bin_15]|nr:TlpA family protein disulfide reductase [Nitrospira sp. SB0667_bin_9]MYD31365.1 TlpA family protein disulfide reductase [Nitrospira sp. SB0661_bin_20]MYG40898.1 TlpA family protein disulfide reductase [Nitrospira sp. SB0677_bin_15]MYH03003.1 TlpA family protein disulfide reductase [Nitrospira sp. SB0675_bin_23]MYJ22678.1 TlpA family protein disulfide reductase [Nitrospira sp. SB0673_bin_12]
MIYNRIAVTAWINTVDKKVACFWKQVVICSLALWFVALGAACDSGYSDERQEHPSVKPVAVRWAPPDMGSQAPDFQLIDLQGNWQALPDYRGKVVLLNFWATWCGPCRVEMPSMEHVYQDLKNEGFAILAISSDPQGSIVTRPFVEAQGLTFPILHDSDYQVSGSYGVRTLPMSFLIDRNGTLTQRVFGARDWNSEEARELIRGLLRES